MRDCRSPIFRRRGGDVYRHAVDDFFTVKLQDMQTHRAQTGGSGRVEEHKVVVSPRFIPSLRLKVGASISDPAWLWSLKRVEFGRAHG